MTSVCRQLIASVAFIVASIFAVVTAGAPALSMLHVLEHAEQAGSLETDGAPQDETGSSCDECWLLSLSREIVLPVGPPVPDNASIAASVERPERFYGYARVPHAPGSPRAPPIG